MFRAVAVSLIALDPFSKAYTWPLEAKLAYAALTITNAAQDAVKTVLYLGFGWLRRRLSWRSGLGFGRSIGGRRLRPSADASGDRFLGGTVLLPDTLWRGLNGVCRPNCFDAPRQFRNARPLVFAGLLRHAGKAGFELVAQIRQFAEIGLVNEGPSEPRLIVAELAFGNSHVLPDGIARVTVTAG
jgi:hypothetical protein